MPVPYIRREQVAELTPGFTGADLANLVNEAALLATRRGAESVHLTDFTAAVERIVAGLEKKNRLLIPKERRIVAYHELGHAIVAMALPGQDPVHKISPLDAICDLMNVRLAELDVVKFLRAALAERARSCPRQGCRNFTRSEGGWDNAKCSVQAA